MTASELIAKLQELQKELGTDPIVLVQCHGCCSHGHDIIKVDEGQHATDTGVDTSDEVGCVVIRV